MIKTTAAAFIGTIAFSLLFGVPKKYYMYCGFVGAAGWLEYWILTEAAGLGVTLATFFATAMVIIVSRICSVWKKTPVTVFLIPGIFPLVPGAGIYWTAYYLVTDSLQAALTSGISAMKVVLAIVLGIVAVFELPNRMFHPRLHKERFHQN